MVWFLITIKSLPNRHPNNPVNWGILTFQIRLFANIEKVQYTTKIHRTFLHLLDGL